MTTTEDTFARAITDRGCARCGEPSAIIFPVEFDAAFECTRTISLCEKCNESFDMIEAMNEAIHRGRRLQAWIDGGRG